MVIRHKLSLSFHARNRMITYDIQREDVMIALRDPRETIADSDHKGRYKSYREYSANRYLVLNKYKVDVITLWLTDRME